MGNKRWLIPCRWAMLAVVAALTVAIQPGCNTIEGAGKDTQSVGKGIEEAAEDAKD